MSSFIVWILALMLSICAGWLDWRSRRIPNWLTVPALVLGLGVNTLARGWPGMKTALMGSGLCLALLLPFVLLRGMGAGDWKLTGALGAFLGPKLVLLVLLGSILIGGCMAVVQMIRHRKVKETLHNLVLLMYAAATFGWRGHRELTLDNPDTLKLPFGVATAAATLLCFLWVLGLRLRA